MPEAHRINNVLLVIPLVEEPGFEPGLSASDLQLYHSTMLLYKGHNLRKVIAQFLALFDLS